MATVRCDVCNGIFSQSYLASHKRLAHAKKDASSPALAATPITEKEAMQKIVFLYESLSVKGRKRIIRFLNAQEQDILNEQ